MSPPILIGGLLLVLFSGQDAWAEESGSCFDENNPSVECAKEGAVGVTVPLLGDSLDANPAMLPSEPTPFGVELMASHRSPPAGKARFGVSTAQGFDGLGFGLGTWRPGSFTAPDLGPHFARTSASAAYQAYEHQDSSGLGFRIGTSVVIPSALFPNFVRWSLGASVGLGEVKGDFSPQVGVLLRISNLGLGYSENFSRLSESLPRVRVSVASAGLYLPGAFLTYSRTEMRTSLNRTHSQAAGIMFPCKNWIFYGGWRWQSNPGGDRDDWLRAGAFRRLGGWARLGYDHGFYRHAHSLVLQVFLGGGASRQ